MTKLSIKARLEKKTISELKKIYVRRNGIDLLRGTKSEMINVLFQNLEAPKNWKIISH